MFVIRNSMRAFLAAILLLAAFHGVIAAIGLAGYLASRIPLPTPDRAFGIFLLRLGIDAALLLLGHLLLRRLGLATRAAYGLLGGIAAALGYGISLQAAIWIASPIAGTIVTAAILPVLIGMISGFLYAQLAGREIVGDLRSKSSASKPARAASPPTYEGPVQVRTSVAAIAMASAMPAIFASMIAVPLGMLAFGNFIPGVYRSDEWSMQVLQLAIPAQTFLVTLMMTALPSAAVIGATHALARSFRCVRGRDYAGIGAVVSCAAALTLMALIHAAFLFPAAAIVGALMGAIYRKFAGLEPLPLPESVLARDPNDLVPEDHPARRTHAVIMNG